MRAGGDWVLRLGSDLNPTCVFHDGQGEFCWAREGRERHGCDFSSCPWFRALLCRVGVCGKRVRLAGERLLVSLLANSSARSSAEHEGSQAKTCLWRLLPWDQPHPGVLWSCHSATWAEQWVRDPLERAGYPSVGWQGAGMCISTGVSAVPWAELRVAGEQWWRALDNRASSSSAAPGTKMVHLYFST